MSSWLNPSATDDSLGHPDRRRKNALAVASLGCGMAGALLFILIVPPVLAIALGAASLGQIRRSNGWQTGRAMAMAGMVLGIAEMVAVGFWLLPGFKGTPSLFG